MNNVQIAPAPGEVQGRNELIEIPDEAVVACPKVAFRLAPVAKCVDCKAFGGLEDRFPGASVDFEKRYLLKCFYDPIKRHMALVVKG